MLQASTQLTISTFPALVKVCLIRLMLQLFGFAGSMHPTALFPGVQGHKSLMLGTPSLSVSVGELALATKRRPYGFDPPPEGTL